MLRFTLRETARLLFGIAGAAALAACLASLDNAHAWHSPAAYFDSVTRHLAAFLRFDFGASAVSGGPAVAQLAERMPPTLIILAMGAALALLIGGPLGIAFGGGPGRRAAAPLIQLVAATPVFCAALALSFVAQRFLHWQMPANAADATAGGMQVDPTNPLPALTALLLPALTVGAAGAATVQLALRRGASRVAHEPYRRGLRRLGLTNLEIDRAFVAPQVLATLVSDAGALALALLAASAVAEWVFNVPGAAVLFVKSVALADWTMAALVLFVIACIALIADYLGRIGAQAISGLGTAR